MVLYLLLNIQNLWFFLDIIIILVKNLKFTFAIENKFYYSLLYQIEKKKIILIIFIKIIQLYYFTSVKFINLEDLMFPIWI